MGHKIFISYKYADDNVRKITNNYYQRDTVRDYVTYLQDYFDFYTRNINKGEEDDEDLSDLSDDTIWEHLKDRIYDSTLTIIMISPNMKEPNRKERNQWIPWEISYSLKEETRKNSAGNMVKSSSNALIALVLPDRNGSYSYFMEHLNCCSEGCTIYKTSKLFNIIKQNMFNVKEPDVKRCKRDDKIYSGDYSYILSVKWEDFINNTGKYIEKAYKLQNSIEQYDIYKEI